MSNSQDVVVIKAIKRRISDEDPREIIVGFEACDRNGKQIETSGQLWKLELKYPNAEVLPK